MFVYSHPDPIAFSLGPLHVRWYGLMYLRRLPRRAGGWPGVARRSPGSTWTPIAGRRPDLLLRRRRDPRRPPRLDAVLRHRADPRRAAQRVPHLGRRHVVPWRPASAWPSRSMLFARSRGKHVVDVFDFTMPLPAIGIRRRPHRQLHQRRTLGQADRRAVGRGRRRRAAASVAALRGGPRRPGAVRDPVVVHVAAAVPLGADRGCSWCATACSASPWSSCACPTRIAATCCSTG